MNLRQLTIEEFNAFAQNYTEYSVYQTSEYGLVMENQGFNILIVGLVDFNNNILAASVLLVEKYLAFKYAYAPRGFLIDYHNVDLLKTFTTKLKKYLAKLDIVAIKLNPMIIKNIHSPKTKSIDTNNQYNNTFSNLKKLGFYHYGYNFYFEALKPRYEAIIDINKPYYILFNEIEKEYRTKIRGAERNGIKIYKGKQSDLNHMYLHSKKKYPRDITYFEDLYYSFSKNNMIEFYYAKLDTTVYLEEIQKKYHEIDQKSAVINNMILSNPGKSGTKLINKKIYYDNLLANYNKNLVTATNFLKNNPDGVVLASTLIVAYRDTVYILMDGYDPKYRMFNAKHLLIWKLIEKYSKLGYKKFNLGGMSNPELDDNKYKGLNEFKTNFGAKVYEYAGDFELITNNAKYFMYKNTLPIKNILKK
ncbi:MAG: peptidoglycan bridge formation glycyltransferase FemA/FemB family protein [Bacilli bacterium]|nr:peptidoglycan bridge formation glycyltransferase FemA/FemB family protein [Bacilli bacterium]MDD4282251.1 peptidoglycan bridge formation glycyltransferase FemA/FemB family protein [Bacilli bacterium]MDD4718631.1 peptidoglycan bridge formation glycyltransferase FemA/FemB family protein [Bacilli bacterium]